MGVDVFEIVDSVGKRSSILNAVCMGTTYDQAWIVRESESLGSPLSHACLRALHGWTRWAGCPRLVRCDRRTHNTGVFSSILAKNDQAWIVRESESLGSPLSHACCVLSFMLDALGLFAATTNTQQRRIQFDSCQERRGDQTCWMEAPEQIERVERRGDMRRR